MKHEVKHNIIIHSLSITVGIIEELISNLVEILVISFPWNQVYMLGTKWFILHENRIPLQTQIHHLVLSDRVQEHNWNVWPSLTVDSDGPTVVWSSRAWIASLAAASYTALSTGFQHLFSLPRYEVAHAQLQNLTHLKLLSTELCISFKMDLGTMMCSGTTVKTLHSIARRVFW